ncbi:MAG: Ppx/GppA family phosphatase [Candidatus Melainabacteria bacterium]|nr:Ppx/GppA family phosphatase [Candidatus Melainabacteria bacterium]
MHDSGGYDSNAWLRLGAQMVGRLKAGAITGKSKSWVKVKGGPVLACIDMGTNSFHMIVCQANLQRDHFDIISRVKESVPFFRRSLTAHFIDDLAQRAAVRILRDMANKAVQKGATTILAVATSAVREARNGGSVLQKIRKELAIDARMISGKEEARLIYLGVLWSMPELAGPFCIVDIGGGSTEIIVGDRDHTRFSESYKLGASRLTQRFFRKGLPTVAVMAELHHEVSGVLRPASAKIAECGGFQELIGTSGTIQALAKLDRLRSDNPHLEAHGWKLSLESLQDLVTYLESSALKGEMHDGISHDRSQTILAGSVVLLETMRSLGVNEITVCKAALREGVVVDRFLQTGWLTAGLEQHRDPRSDSVHALLEKYSASIEHAEQVAKLSQEIFLQTYGVLHKYPEEAGHLLWSAAMLHDVGTFVGRNGHHKHSYYLIKNCGLLGHSEEEVELIACIARYHRGSQPKSSHDEFRVLSSEERKLVTDMAAILRIAEALDRSHRQVVREVKMSPPGGIRSERKEVAVNLILKDKETCNPEMWAFDEKKAFFEECFQVKLVLNVQGPGLSVSSPSLSEASY